MRTYVRVDPPDADPERLLDPEEQQSEPWSGTVYGRCDKCGGDGRTMHECESCKVERDTNCPACHGELRYEDECPACEGSGEIDDSSRDGISVFPDEDASWPPERPHSSQLNPTWAGAGGIGLSGRPSGTAGSL